jgi:hypothetical protein
MADIDESAVSSRCDRFALRYGRSQNVTTLKTFFPKSFGSGRGVPTLVVLAE